MLFYLLEIAIIHEDNIIYFLDIIWTKLKARTIEIIRPANAIFYRLQSPKQLAFLSITAWKTAWVIFYFSEP